jgi:hypothetical protein
MRVLSAAGLGLALGLAGAAPATALPLISEVFYDAVGTDDGQSFVELYGAAGSALDGLVLEAVNGADGGVTHTLALTGVFGADGLFVVADRTSAGTTAVADADLLLDFDFQNGPDSVVLRNAAGVLDAVAYGVFGAGEVSAGEGAPAPDAPAGQSVARRFANVDTDDNAADFVAGAPTPGLASLPEPRAAALLALGLLGLLRLGRRR